MRRNSPRAASVRRIITLRTHRPAAPARTIRATSIRTRVTRILHSPLPAEQGADIPIDTELETARAQLDQMPLDAPTQPAPLPRGSLMRPASNPLFGGRGGDLRRLAQAVKSARTVVIAGAEGVGKTRLAVEF